MALNPKNDSNIKLQHLTNVISCLQIYNIIFEIDNKAEIFLSNRLLSDI